MKIVHLVVAAALSTVATLPVSAHAGDAKAKAEVVMKMGNKLHLFHSGPTEVSKEIAAGETLPVFRPAGKSGSQQKEVGQVKVTGFIGEHYFEAEVVKGEAKVGDIAKKDGSGFLVQPKK